MDITSNSPYLVGQNESIGSLWEIISNCNFIHSYITINYGESSSYIDLSSSGIYSFNVLNSNFSNYNSSSTIYNNDIDYNAIYSLNHSATCFEHNAFKNSFDTYSIININSISNSFEDNIYIINRI